MWPYLDLWANFNGSLNQSEEVKTDLCLVLEVSVWITITLSRMNKASGGSTLRLEKRSDALWTFGQFHSCDKKCV